MKRSVLGDNEQFLMQLTSYFPIENLRLSLTLSSSAPVSYRLKLQSCGTHSNVQDPVGPLL